MNISDKNISARQALVEQIDKLRSELALTADFFTPDRSPEYYEMDKRLLEATLAYRQELDRVLRRSSQVANARPGLAFQASGNIPTQHHLEFIEKNIPEALWDTVLSSKVDNITRDMLLSFVVLRKSIKGLLESEFGCSPEAAQQAEMLVREFLRATEGIELPEEAHEASEAAALSLPDAPPAYPYVPRMDGGIIKYLEDNWSEHIKAGVLTRPALKQIDEPAWMALNNWLRNNELPQHLHVPSRSEVVDKAVSAHGLESVAATPATEKLLATVASRQRRSREPKP